MAEQPLGRLRRWLQGAPPAPEEPVADAGPPIDGSIGREIEFAAYTEDCRVYGFLQLEAERLSDLLNHSQEFELNSVLLVALEDNHVIEMNRLVLQREEIVAVRATAPRGNPGRRSRTRPAPVGMRAGPYLIHAYLHIPPGSDPLHQFRRRMQMVPVTEGRIEYTAGGQPHRARVGTLIVNRDFVDWMDHARDAEVRLDLPAEMRLDPRAKDYTGSIRVWRDDADVA